MRKGFMVLMVLLLATYYLPLATVEASSFKILGNRPLAMGGAFVAVADDALAQYWNPAGLARQKWDKKEGRYKGGGFDLQIPVGVQAEITGGLLKEANDVANLETNINNIQNAINGNNVTAGGTAANPSGGLYDDYMKVIKEIGDLNTSGLGALADVSGGVNLRVMKFGVYLNNFTEVGFDPELDLVNIGVISGSGGVDFNEFIRDFDNNGSYGGYANTGYSSAETNLATALTDAQSKGISLPGTPANCANEMIAAAIASGMTADEATGLSTTVSSMIPLVVAAGTGDYTKNNSRIQTKGIMAFEGAVGAGVSLDKFIKDLSVGLNIKIIQGRVGYTEIAVKNADSMDKVNFQTNTKSSTKFGCDFGLMYNKRKQWRTKLGFVAKNIGSPSFDYPESGTAVGLTKYKMGTQLRAGLAFYPLNFITLATDLDITANVTPVGGYKSRMFGMGGEFNFINKPAFNLALRAGWMKNIGQKNTPGLITAGFGLNLIHVVLDFGGAISMKKTTIRDKSYPTAFGAGLTLSVNF